MTPPPSPTDGTSPSLLVRVRANEAGAWERLVDLYAPLVYHWCHRCRLPPEDVADVFQEVFRAVAEHIGGFRHDRPGDSFRAWLRTITRTKVCDHLRRQAAQPQAPGGTDAQRLLHEVPAPELDDEDAGEAGLVAQQVRRVLDLIRGEFEERTWRAFWEVQMEDRGTDEVGAELGMTPAAVRKAKFRVLRRLREEMGEFLE
jgi:RNA polymerase sigma-70 factor (ECF subfamily)